MSKIIPFEIFKEHSGEQHVCDEKPKTGFIQNVIRKIKDVMDFCCLQSDEYDDYYDGYYDDK